MIVGSAGWVFSNHLRPGAWLAAAKAADLRLAGVRVERRFVTTYNLHVASSHTYFVGRSAAWVHNSGTPELLGEGTDATRGRFQRWEDPENPSGVSHYLDEGTVEVDWVGNAGEVRDVARMIEGAAGRGPVNRVTGYLTDDVRVYRWWW